mmetsp:Transcript_24796/g.52576  ORF Transcript_24796/g.52576 Transcript_24796/m.52576 type:complete len:617 (+) Transcript_24796:117-1967(+)
MTDTPQLSEIRIISPELAVESDDISSRRARQATAEILATDNDNNNNMNKKTTRRNTIDNVVSSSSSSSSSSRRSPFLKQDEGVLMEVLAELDRERHKRAELEAKVRVLEQEVQIHRRKSSKSSKTSMRDYTIVKTERDGYKEILDALTQDRPAFSICSTSNGKQQKRDDPYNQQQSLPIHIVRLLEVMPWDSRAQQYVFGEEHVYEWQIYSADKKWQKELRYFPTFFKTLPIVVPSPGKTVSDEAAAAKTNPFFGAANIAPPKQCVLTDLEGKTIFNIDKGYPLPEDGGGWTWVGPWKVEKNNDTDEQGWTYSNETQFMSDISTYHGQFLVPEKGTPNIMKRRRKWIRPRTLIDYPYASKMTQEYLKLIAEKSRLGSSFDKLSGQLVDTKMSLTTLEADEERTSARMRVLERDLDDKNKILGLVEHGAGLKLIKAAATTTTGSTPKPSDGHSKSLDSTKKVDDIRSAVTQWVSNTVHKQLQPTNEDSTIATAPLKTTKENYEKKGNGHKAEVDENNSSIGPNSSPDQSILVTQLVQQQQQQQQQRRRRLRHPWIGIAPSLCGMPFSPYGGIGGAPISATTARFIRLSTLSTGCEPTWLTNDQRPCPIPMSFPAGYC